MLNKKGFTIAEVLVSFTLITVILLSIIGSTVFYRDKLKTEEVKSQLIDFKNGITKIIYDDIINDKARRVETCLGIANCINIVNEDGTIHNLRIYEVPVTSSGEKRGAYLMYDGVKYFLPDSDLAGIDENEGTVRVCDFTNGIRFSYYKDMYTIKISFTHKDYDIHKDIMLTVIGGKDEYSYVQPAMPTLVLADERIKLAPDGINKTTSYTYTGNGNISCESSDPTIAKCSVDKTNKKIVVMPVSIGDNVTITVTASATADYYPPEPASFIVDVNKKTPTLTVTNSNVNLTYGTNGNNGNGYTYNGDGVVLCNSSNMAKVTCSVDTANKKIQLVPKEVTTAAVTITISAGETDEYFAPTNATFTVNVAKQKCNAPTNVSISANGIVTWNASSNCSSAQHQISLDGTNFTNATSGTNYNSTLTASTGSKTVYVKSLAPNSNYSASDNGSKSTTVYSVSLTKGTGVETITGAGNYISGSSVTLNATFNNPYYWLKWTDVNLGTDVSTTKEYAITVRSNVSLKANVGDGCASGNTTTSTTSSGTCFNVQCYTNSITTTTIINSKVIPNYVCSTRTESRACDKGDNCWWWSLIQEQTGDICGVACPTMCDNRGANDWQCLQTSTTYRPYSQEYWGTYCWCRS